jgi:HAD superfamily hydrolase (TIGR01450 family)
VLLSTDRPLNEVHDLAVLDLDGVVYVGPDAVPGAAEGLRAARAAGMQLAYVTNNASRTPEGVAEHLVELGFEAQAADVVTSSQAAARLLSEQLPAGSTVFALGGEGLHAALDAVGLHYTTDPAEKVAAVVQGYGPKVPWRSVIDAAILVKQGRVWVATNADMTFATANGVGPGNGALVDLVARFAERSPQVAGKPETALFEETRDRIGGRDPVVVGDRIDTDIAGAVRMGWPGLLVMTGVTGLRELVEVPPETRPSYLAAGLGALTVPHDAPERDQNAWVCDGWRADVSGGRIAVTGSGGVDGWWRVLACAAWAHLDDTGTPVDLGDVRPPR